MDTAIKEVADAFESFLGSIAKLRDILATAAQEVESATAPTVTESTTPPVDASTEAPAAEATDTVTSAS